MTDVMTYIKQRRSIRKFLTQAVEREKLVMLLQAAMAAPTARNSKPWEFVAITDPARLEQCRQSHEYGNYNGQAAIVVCGNPQVSNSPATAQKNWMLDCSAATENLLIAAAGLGLGAVWCGIWPRAERVAAFSHLFGLPSSSIPLCLVWVGYPDEIKESRTQYDEERVHWQHY